MNENDSCFFMASKSLCGSPVTLTSLTVSTTNFRLMPGTLISTFKTAHTISSAWNASWDLLNTLTTPCMQGQPQVCISHGDDWKSNLKPTNKTNNNKNKMGRRFPVFLLVVFLLMVSSAMPFSRILPFLFQHDHFYSRWHSLPQSARVSQPWLCIRTILGSF